MIHVQNEAISVQVDQIYDAVDFRERLAEHFVDLHSLAVTDLDFFRGFRFVSMAHENEKAQK
jgi:hypothetical protein